MAKLSEKEEGALRAYEDLEPVLGFWAGRDGGGVRVASSGELTRLPRWKVWLVNWLLRRA